MHLALILVAAAGIQETGVQTYSVNGVERQALVVAPTKATDKAPVVFAFHGHGGNMRHSRRSFHVDALWPEALVVYPQGLPTKGMTDPDGKKPGWQKVAGDYEDRDLKFVDAMLAKLKKDYKIDEKRIYAMGHSNGGRFTYVLWANRGDVFAAYGPSGSPAGLMIPSFKPRPAFLVAGEKDPLVAFEGQSRTADGLKRLLGTDASTAKVDGYTRYEKGKNGLELGTYFHPGGHEYPRQAAKLTVEFFKRHSK
jgi:polyhydroxybutyrate depolymerase